MAEIVTVDGFEIEVGTPVYKRLVAEGRIKLDGAVATPADGPVFDFTSEKVGAVISHVGGDPALARQALAAEQAATRPRSSLVSQLEAILEADDDSGGSEGDDTADGAE